MRVTLGVAVGAAGVAVSVGVAEGVPVSVGLDVGVSVSVGVGTTAVLVSVGVAVVVVAGMNGPEEARSIEPAVRRFSHIHTETHRPPQSAGTDGLTMMSARWAPPGNG